VTYPSWLSDFDEPMDLSGLFTIAGPVSQATNGTLSMWTGTTNIAGSTISVQFDEQVSGNKITLNRVHEQINTNTDVSVTADYVGTVAGTTITGTATLTYYELDTYSDWGGITTGTAAGTFTAIITNIHYLTGHVYSTCDDSPVLGASVHISSYTATTDSNGSYVITGIPRGNYQATVSHPNCFTTNTTVIIPSVELTVTHDFWIAPLPPILVGHVYCSCDSSPIPDASVQLINHTAMTDGQGS
jgi:hypothetical protein